MEFLCSEYTQRTQTKKEYKQLHMEFTVVNVYRSRDISVYVNVLHICNIRAIPTYRVDQLDDIARKFINLLMNFVTNYTTK